MYSFDGEIFSLPFVVFPSYSFELAKAQLAEAQARYEKTLIRSPINGVILRKHHRSGESVSNSSTVPDPIVTIGDNSRLRVRVDVDETEVAKVKVGQPAYVTADAFDKQKFPGPRYTRRQRTRQEKCPDLRAHRKSRYKDIGDVNSTRSRSGNSDRSPRRCLHPNIRERRIQLSRIEIMTRNTCVVQDDMGCRERQPLSSGDSEIDGANI